jgi:hypothetical protein
MEGSQQGAAIGAADILSKHNSRAALHSLLQQKINSATLPAAVFFFLAAVSQNTLIPRQISAQRVRLCVAAVSDAPKPDGSGPVQGFRDSDAGREGAAALARACCSLRRREDICCDCAARCCGGSTCRILKLTLVQCREQNRCCVCSTIRCPVGGSSSPLSAVGCACGRRCRCQ